MHDSLSTSPLSTYGAAIPRQQYAPVVYQSGPAPRAPSVWDTYRSMFLEPERAMSPVQSAVQGLRHSGEGAALSALLALAYRHFGTLDVAGKYPADAILGFLLFGLSIKNAGAPEGYSGDLRALSQSCSDVYVFRKLSGIDSEKTKPVPQISATSQSRGVAKDPILEAAQRLGI